MKKLLLLLSVCIMTLNVSAQDIFNEVKKMKDNAEALMNDKTKDLETRKIACFKYDVLYYLIGKAATEDTFTEYELGVQANAMIDFVNLYLKRLADEDKKKDREIVMEKFKNATIQNALFNDTDKELVYAYVDNEKYIIIMDDDQMDEFEKKGQVGIRRVINSRLGIDNEERVKALARWLKDRNSRDRATRNLWKVGYTRMQRDVVRHVDYFLPNSEMEMEMLCRNLHLKKENYQVIPNAVDGEAACRLRGTAVPSEFERFRGAVVCVGRIEPRKNQLALVRALDGLPYRLVLVGAVSANQKSYFEEIRRYLKRNPDFYYLPGMEQEKLYQLYRVCRVSALPSWLDTPGLVSLEAGVMGCSLAVSSKGSTTEYFGNYAEYCLPDDLDSIRRAVAAAYQKPQTTALQEKILNSYTWKIAAEKTLDSYHAVLERARAGH